MKKRKLLYGMLGLFILANVAYVAYSLTVPLTCAPYQVQCYRWDVVNQRYDCLCRYFICPTGYTRGACPTDTSKPTGNLMLDLMHQSNQIAQLRTDIMLNNDISGSQTDSHE